MSKSNPTTRPDAPNYEVVCNMIHRYEPKPERIQLTDTQLLDKLAESEIKLQNGSQLWQVFTDRDDPQMTLREAIEAWGATE